MPKYLVHMETTTFWTAVIETAHENLPDDAGYDDLPEDVQILVDDLDAEEDSNSRSSEEVFAYLEPCEEDDDA